MKNRSAPTRFFQRRNSVRARLMVWNMVTLAVLLGLVSLVAGTLVRSFMLSAVDRELAMQAQRVMMPPPPPRDGPHFFGGPWHPDGRRPDPNGGPSQPFGQGPDRNAGPRQPFEGGPNPNGGPGQPFGGGPGPNGGPGQPFVGGPDPNGGPGQPFDGGPDRQGPPYGAATAQNGGQGQPGGPGYPQNGGSPQPYDGGPDRNAGSAQPHGSGPGRNGGQPGGWPGNGQPDGGLSDVPSRSPGSPGTGKEGDASVPVWYRPRILDLLGEVVHPTDVTEPWDRAGYKAAVRGQKLYTNVVVKGVPLRVFSRSFWQGRSRRVVQAAYPLAEVNRVLAWLNAALLALIPLMLVASATGGAFLTDRALRPVRQVAHAAARIGAHDLAERLPVVGNDEFWELAVTFNGMLGRLQGSFAEKQRLVDRLEKLVEQERRFTADASHELRTPLAIIKANSSLALSAQQPVEEYQKSLEEIDQAANSMARLVQDLLLLARSDAGQLGRAWTALSIRNIVSRAAARVRSEDRILNLTPAALRVPGSEGEILRLFTNLLENASRYTPAGGTITVSAQEEGTSVHVSVADTGTGIAPEHLAHLGERFYRVDASRSRPDGGTGLGLSICKSIVEAHGGSMHFESKEGSGTTVHVLLPAGAEEQQSDSPDGRN